MTFFFTPPLVSGEVRKYQRVHEDEFEELKLPDAVAEEIRQSWQDFLAKLLTLPTPELSTFWGFPYVVGIIKLKLVFFPWLLEK